MTRTYLVTGAAGFIGSKLAKRIIEMGHVVVTVDNLSTGSVSAIPKGVIFIQGDCQSQEVVLQLDQFRFDAVFHIAGQSSGEISFEDPVYDLQTNAQSTLQLLQYCRKSGCKKFIYASSMSVYGDQSQLPVKEDSECMPNSFYAVGKLASEHYLRIYSQFGIQTTALRFFNVYGPGQNLSNMKQGMVSIFLSMALSDKTIHVKGDAKRFRDFIFIDDLVEGIWKSLNRVGEEYEVVNLCSGIKTEVGEVVEIITNCIEDNVQVIFSGSTLGDQFGIYGSKQYAKELLNWESEISLDKGMQLMYEWARNNISDL
jgi:UDP-glucose 4-epimerase